MRETGGGRADRGDAGAPGIPPPVSLVLSHVRLVVLALLALTILYLLLVAAVWRMQERIVWQPPRLASFPEGDARRLEYASDDGQPLYAYLVGEPATAPGLLVACHGNADLA